jgi:hypothetical protein
MVYLRIDAGVQRLRLVIGRAASGRFPGADNALRRQGFAAFFARTERFFCHPVWRSHGGGLTVRCIEKQPASRPINQPGIA